MTHPFLQMAHEAVLHALVRHDGALFRRHRAAARRGHGEDDACRHD